MNNMSVLVKATSIQVLGAVRGLRFPVFEPRQQLGWEAENVDIFKCKLKKKQNFFIVFFFKYLLPSVFIYII